MGGFGDICGRSGMLFFIEEIIFLYYLVCLHMSGYELSIYEIVPFDVSISICTKIKKKQKETKEGKRM